MPEQTITVYMLAETKRPIGFTAWSLADEQRQDAPETKKKAKKHKKGK